MSAIGKIKDALGLASAAQQAVRSLTEADEQIREQLRADDKERLQVFTAIPPTSEIIASIPALVDAAAAAHLQQFGAHYLLDLSGHYEGRTDARERYHKPKLPILPRALNGTQEMTLPALAVFAPDALISGLTRLVESQAAGRLQLTAAERTKRLAALDERRERLLAEHAALVKSAAEAGIALPALPQNRARQEREQAEAERRKPKQDAQDLLNETARRRAALRLG